MPYRYDHRPTSIRQCVDEDGEVDVDKFHDYVQRRVDEGFNEFDEFHARRVAEMEEELDELELGMTSKKPTQRIRRCKKVLFKGIGPDGQEFEMGPEDSAWFALYVDANDNNLREPKFRKKFRRRFRMP